MKTDASTGLGLLTQGHQTTLTSITAVDASTCGYSCDACVNGAWDEPRSWCWKDQQCHEVGSLFNPCSSSQCVSATTGSQCKCSSCDDTQCGIAAGVASSANNTTSKATAASHGTSAAGVSGATAAVAASVAVVATVGAAALVVAVRRARIAEEEDNAGYQLHTDNGRPSLAAL